MPTPTSTARCASAPTTQEKGAEKGEEKWAEEGAELRPRLCRMEMTKDGYGFHLNGIQGVHGQHIKEVGASERSGPCPVTLRS